MPLHQLLKCQLISRSHTGDQCIIFSRLLQSLVAPRSASRSLVGRPFGTANDCIAILIPAHHSLDQVSSKLIASHQTITVGVGPIQFALYACQLATRLLRMQLVR